jgi:hypothetical protein
MCFNELESEGVKSSKVSQSFVRWWSFVNAVFTRWREISFRAERVTPSQEITFYEIHRSVSVQDVYSSSCIDTTKPDIKKNFLPRNFAGSLQKF